MTISFRDARESDVPDIVRMLLDDALGATREGKADPLSLEYREAFAAITSSPDNRLIVSVDAGDQVLGCLQLTIIPGLSRLGMSRALIEGVRVHKAARDQGLGRALINHAIEEARSAGCGLVQLTTDKSRGDAHRFYEGLGFEPSHVGMKLKL